MRVSRSGFPGQMETPHVVTCPLLVNETLQDLKFYSGAPDGWTHFAKCVQWESGSRGSRGLSPPAQVVQSEPSGCRKLRGTKDALPPN